MSAMTSGGDTRPVALSRVSRARVVTRVLRPGRCPSGGDRPRRPRTPSWPTSTAGDRSDDGLAKTGKKTCSSSTRSTILAGTAASGRRRAHGVVGDVAGPAESPVVGLQAVEQLTRLTNGMPRRSKKSDRGEAPKQRSSLRVSAEDDRRPSATGGNASSQMKQNAHAPVVQQVRGSPRG